MFEKSAGAHMTPGIFFLAVHRMAQLQRGYESPPIFSERELRFTFAICHRPSVCLSSVTFVHPAQAIEIFGHVSMTFGTYRKPVRDFLLVINTNCHPISYRFEVIADYWSNLRRQLVALPPKGSLGQRTTLFLL